MACGRGGAAGSRPQSRQGLQGCLHVIAVHMSGGFGSGAEPGRLTQRSCSGQSRGLRPPSEQRCLLQKIVNAGRQGSLARVMMGYAEQCCIITTVSLMCGTTGRSLDIFKWSRYAGQLQLWEREHVSSFFTVGHLTTTIIADAGDPCNHANVLVHGMNASEMTTLTRVQWRRSVYLQHSMAPPIVVLSHTDRGSLAGPQLAVPF